MNNVMNNLLLMSISKHARLHQLFWKHHTILIKEIKDEHILKEMWYNLRKEITEKYLLENEDIIKLM